MTDLEIAQKAQMLPIREVAKKLNISEDDLDPYGKYKAKLPLHLINAEKMKHSKLVLVTAITPTPAGEGKTTVSIGLTEGLNRIGKKAIAVLREPSLGPVFGIKGGAAGGGYSQVVPMEDINLHFTGDFSAIEKANNLLAAVIDNNIQSKTHSIGIDPRTVVWKRVMDMNDRALRHIVVGLGGATHGVPREDGFNITPASEIMAILCLAESFSDLKKRIGNIYVGKKFDGTPVFARDLKVVGAMALLLKEAIKAFDGTAIVVSHDREFLDGLVSKVYEFGEGRVKEHLGGIYDFIRNATADQPNNALPTSIDSLLHTASAPAKTEETPKADNESYAQRKERMKKVSKAEKAVKECEARIASMEKRIGELNVLLSDVDNASDMTLVSEYTSVQRALDSENEKWMELSETLEKLSQQAS